MTDNIDWSKLISTSFLDDEQSICPACGQIIFPNLQVPPPVESLTQPACNTDLSIDELAYRPTDELTVDPNYPPADERTVDPYNLHSKGQGPDFPLQTCKKRKVAYKLSKHVSLNSQTLCPAPSESSSPSQLLHQNELVTHPRQKLSRKAIAACYLWLTHHCGKSPTEYQLLGLSLAWGASYESLQRWFKKPKDIRTPSYTTIQTQSEGSGTAEMFNRYPVACSANKTLIYQDNQILRHSHGKDLPVYKRDAMKPYACTFRCDYKAKKKGEFKKHEERHYPQQLWQCDQCDHQPFFRRGRFQAHLMGKHDYSDVLSEAIRRCALSIDSQYPRMCILQSCETTLHPWKNRIDHIAKHMEEPWDMSEWRDLYISSSQEDLDHLPSTTRTDSDSSSSSDSDNLPPPTGTKGSGLNRKAVSKSSQINGSGSGFSSTVQNTNSPSTSKHYSSFPAATENNGSSSIGNSLEVNKGPVERLLHNVISHQAQVTLRNRYAYAAPILAIPSQIPSVEGHLIMPIRSNRGTKPDKDKALQSLVTGGESSKNNEFVLWSARRSGYRVLSSRLQVNKRDSGNDLKNPSTEDFSSMMERYMDEFDPHRVFLLRPRQSWLHKGYSARAIEDFDSGSHVSSSRTRSDAASSRQNRPTVANDRPHSVFNNSSESHSRASEEITEYRPIQVWDPLYHIEFNESAARPFSIVINIKDPLALEASNLGTNKWGQKYGD
ncbi:hypothetical protein MMC19_005138 [Ptychographa xylographoides]|nr:hypothetical protein [Ptychographa xylographoides]